MTPNFSASWPVLILMRPVLHSTNQILRHFYRPIPLFQNMPVCMSFLAKSSHPSSPVLFSTYERHVIEQLVILLVCTDKPEPIFLSRFINVKPLKSPRSLKIFLTISLQFESIKTSILTLSVVALFLSLSPSTRAVQYWEIELLVLRSCQIKMLAFHAYEKPNKRNMLLSFRHQHSHFCFVWTEKNHDDLSTLLQIPSEG